MICDNDSEGQKFIKQVKDRGLTQEQCTELVRPLPGTDVNLEKFLVNNGFAEEYRQILQERNVNLTAKEGETGFEDEIVSRISTDKDKTGYTTALIEKLRAAGADESRVPQFLSTAINDIIAKAIS